MSRLYNDTVRCGGVCAATRSLRVHGRSRPLPAGTENVHEPEPGASRRCCSLGRALCGRHNKEMPPWGGKRDAAEPSRAGECLHLLHTRGNCCAVQQQTCTSDVNNVWRPFLSDLNSFHIYIFFVGRMQLHKTTKLDMEPPAGGALRHCSS